VSDLLKHPLSTLATSAIDRAGLGPLLVAWSTENFAALASLAPIVEKQDILVLGILADSVRRAHLGDTVRAHTSPSTLGASDHLVQGSADVLREVAVARILRPPTCRVAVDLATVGPTLAQVALTFGATDLVGFLVNKRGLPLASDGTRKVKGEGQVPLATLKERELLRVLAVAGRPAEFVRVVPALTTGLSQESRGLP